MHGEMRNAYRIVVEKILERDVGVDGRITKKKKS
jgi:hypothetical protein